MAVDTVETTGEIQVLPKRINQKKIPNSPYRAAKSVDFRPFKNIHRLLILTELSSGHVFEVIGKRC